ncbi:hypothetical protein LY76DRAFT_243164 [Colletotrichum caudatum]|nr:hypothetical protein LY76DRAFT_243164 [Colletotrichum caudatum]
MSSPGSPLLGGGDLRTTSAWTAWFIAADWSITWLFYSVCLAPPSAIACLTSSTPRIIARRSAARCRPLRSYRPCCGSAERVSPTQRLCSSTISLRAQAGRTSFQSGLAPTPFPNRPVGSSSLVGMRESRLHPKRHLLVPHDRGFIRMHSGCPIVQATYRQTLCFYLGAEYLHFGAYALSTEKRASTDIGIPLGQALVIQNDLSQHVCPRQWHEGRCLLCRRGIDRSSRLIGPAFVVAVNLPTVKLIDGLTWHQGRGPMTVAILSGASPWASCRFV